MARSMANDYLQLMRFQVTLVSSNTGEDFLGTNSPTDAAPKTGFMSVSMPEMQVDFASYRDGTMIYTRKQPGIPSANKITMSRGVTRKDSTFWNWLQRVIEGSGEYRADITINMYTRDTSLTLRTDNAVDKNQQYLNGFSNPARSFTCYEAFPTSHKVSTDLASNSSEIAIMELGVEFEYMSTKTTDAPTTPIKSA